MYSSRADRYVTGFTPDAKLNGRPQTPSRRALQRAVLRLGSERGGHALRVLLGASLKQMPYSRTSKGMSPERATRAGPPVRSPQTTNHRRTASSATRIADSRAA